MVMDYVNRVTWLCITRKRENKNNKPNLIRTINDELKI